MIKNKYDMIHIP